MKGCQEGGAVKRGCHDDRFHERGCYEGGFVKGGGMKEPPPGQQESETHPTGMLSCF